jgi:site-specific recombinase XerD
MKMSEMEFFLEDFLVFCQSKNLSPKTLSSYEQSLKLFIAYLKNEHDVDEVISVKAGHIRQYIAHDKSTREVYEDYSIWCHRNGFDRQMVTQPTLTKAINRIKYYQAKQTKIKGENVRIFSRKIVSNCYNATKYYFKPLDMTGL